MNANIENALTEKFFVASKYINMIANDKDASTTLQQLYYDFSKTTEKSNDHIIKILSENHTKIMNAARDAIQIEQEIKGLQQSLVDQSKLIYEISNMKQPTYFHQTSSENLQPEKYNKILSCANVEESLHVETLLKSLKMMKIEHDYKQFSSLIESIKRLIINFDLGIQSEYNRQLSEMSFEICETITSQILNINELFFTDTFSIFDLLTVLISLNQHDLCITTYLKLTSNKITNDLLKSFQFAKNENYFDKIQKLVNQFLLILSESHEFIKLKLSFPNFKPIFYFWAEDQVKILLNYMIIDSSQHVSFLDFCKCISSVLTICNESANNLEIDLSRIIRKNVFSHLESSLSVFIRHSISDIKLLITNDFSKTKDISLLSKSQQQFILEYDYMNFHSSDQISLAVIYIYCIVYSLMKECNNLIKKSKIIQNIEIFLYFCLNCIKDITKTKTEEQVENFNENVIFFKEQIITLFEKSFPKSTFSHSNSHLLNNLAQ